LLESNSTREQVWAVRVSPASERKGSLLLAGGPADPAITMAESWSGESDQAAAFHSATSGAPPRPHRVMRVAPILDSLSRT